jgi:hypothetical protein
MVAAQWQESTFAVIAVGAKISKPRRTIQDENRGPFEGSRATRKHRLSSSNVPHQTPDVMATREPMGQLMEDMGIAHVEAIR